MEQQGYEQTTNNPEEYEDYGYCRVSTPKQNIDRQVRNILDVLPNAHIIKETYTGTKIAGRKDWNRLYKHIEKRAKVKKVRIGFDSVSRFSRNADEGCELYEKLFNMGVTLIFIKERHIDTDVYRQALQNQIELRLDTGDKATDEFINSIIDALNKYTLDLAKAQIRIAFEQAEKEVLDLHKRTSEGLQTAKMNGKKIGISKGTKLVTKKSIAAKEVIKKLSRDFYGTNTDAEVIKITGIARNTFYKYKKQLAEELANEQE